MELVRNHEELSEYYVGHFGDWRLARVGALLLKRLCGS